MRKAMYVHVPFCNKICAYCDFMRCGYYAPLVDEWLKAVTIDVRQRAIEPLSTLYIGGGTPSSLSFEQLKSLLILFQPYLHACLEFTIEANADSLDEEKIKLIKQYGVNRISLGAQTFQPHLLKRIERDADYAMIKHCIDLLHKHGIDNISIDLMYGLPKQTMQDWQLDLSMAITLPIQHISLYALTMEEHSKFGREGIIPCDENLEADLYEYAIAYLQEHGFEHYEISNFAKKDYRSKHNMAYWHYDDFYGIGCGASGKEDHVRYDNTHNLHTYLTEGPSPQNITLSITDEMFETIMMGLRVREGISDACFQERFSISLLHVYAQAIQKQSNLGNLVFEDGFLHVTYQGQLLLHEVLLDFMQD